MKDQMLYNFMNKVVEVGIELYSYIVFRNMT